MPYLKGLKLWPYIDGTILKPDTAEIDKLIKWEEADAQALSTILMNIAPNVQAGLDCSSAKAAWDGLLSRYVQVDPITKPSSDPPTCKALCGRRDGDFTKSYRRTSTTEVSLQRTWSGCHRPTIRRCNHSLHAYPILGSHDRNLGRSARSESHYFTTQHRMESETRTHREQQRLQCCIPGQRKVTHQVR